MSSKDTFFEAEGPYDYGFGFLTRLDGFTFGADLRGTIAGMRGLSGPGNESTQGNSYAQSAGVIGTSGEHVGVSGVSLNSAGVYGQTGDFIALPQWQAGVYGAAGTRPGVRGSSGSGDGVQGASFTGTALAGWSFFGSAMVGFSRAVSGVIGVSETEGPKPRNLPATIAGVVGSAKERIGLIGTSDTFVGVYGSSNNYGIVGQTMNPASYAGRFIGNVAVTGTLTANAGAMATFPDGSRRLLQCMASPEHWFEDFGAARLKGGRAVVKLDADFAKVIRRGDYHVFLTAKGDCGGLYVRRRGGARFEVRELGGGKSDVAFSYRIVGRRKDIKAHRRFAKIDARLRLPIAKRSRPTSSAGGRALSRRNAGRGR